MCKTRNNNRRARGFSLIEALVVVVITGLLAGSVAVGVIQYLDSARRQRAKSDIASIASAIDRFYQENSRYPTHDEGLEGLGLKTRLMDPWGRRYEYRQPAANSPDEPPYEVFTYGQDGREGGEGADGDLFSWQLNEAEATGAP